MDANSVLLLALALPLVIGVVVAALNSESVNEATEKAEAWARAKDARLDDTSGRLSRYVAKPLLRAIAKFSDWTDNFGNRGLKNGARVAGTLYLAIAWAYILLALVQIIIAIAVVALIVYVGFKILLNNSDDVRRGYEATRRVVGTAPPGHRVNPETGIIQEKGLIGWIDTEQRVDPETGRVQTKGLIGWMDTDTRIEQQSGRIQEKGLLGFQDTETRIDPDTGVIQKKGLLAWQDTDERIDPETGRHQKRGLMGWMDD